MANLNDIVNMRRQPGVIILDGTGTVLFMNEIASSLVPIIRLQGSDGDTPGPPTLPEEIRMLCLQVASAGAGEPRSRSGVFFADDISFSLRIFPVSAAVEGSGPPHVMVLVEPVVERHQVNYAAVQQQYGISKRELDVLKLICLGLSNREIAERLFISEHTAKDHVKSILSAFDAVSRGEVIAALIG